MSVAEILSPEPANLARAAEALRRGELVAMPTETVYGLAGNALDAQAVARIFATKDRPKFDPLIVHVPPEAKGLEALARDELVDVAQIDADSRARAERLIARFWPGPLTLVLPRGPRVPDLVTSGMPTVAIRMPRHPVAQALLRETRRPLAAPSANRFGRISPTSASDVLSELGDRIGFIIDGGPCELGVESTVLALDANGATLLRPGGVPRAEIEAVLGMPLRRPEAQSEGPAASPGMLASHYAPRKPLLLLDGDLESAQFPERLPATVGVLAQRGDATRWATKLAEMTGRVVRVQVLSPEGNLEEAARRLFAALRALDASDAELLFAESCPTEEGLGHAIQDRLRRASAR